MSKITLPRVGTLLWIRKEHYHAMLEIFDDSDEWPPTYEEWLKGSEDIEQQIRAVGGLSRRVYIDPETFRDVCRQHGVRPDANGRMKIMLTITAQDPTPE
jgi:hypothetical protein